MAERQEIARQKVEQPRIRDFSCTFATASGISPQTTAGLDLVFPEAHKHRESLAQLARAIRERNGAGYTLLPLCYTVEAEAHGGKVNFGDASSGPRPGEPICTSIEDFMALPAIDFSTGRIREVLEACRILSQSGERVCLTLVGPWTQMQSLMEPRHMFKMQRKQPERMLDVMNKLADELLPYADEARECGVQVLTFSDSAGTLDILSPKLMEWSVREFVHPFLKRLVEHVDDTMILQLCPKYAYALVDLGLAEVKVHEFGERVDFFEAIVQLRGKAKIVGQTCIKDVGTTIANGRVRELVLV